MLMYVYASKACLVPMRSRIDSTCHTQVAALASRLASHQSNYAYNHVSIFIFGINIPFDYIVAQPTSSHNLKFAPPTYNLHFLHLYNSNLQPTTYNPCLPLSVPHTTTLHLVPCWRHPSSCKISTETLLDSAVHLEQPLVGWYTPTGPPSASHPPPFDLRFATNSLATA